MKIKYKLLWTYGVLVALAFTIIGVNLMTFRMMESDSNFVNNSGRLRATNYKMAQFSNVIVNNEEEKLKSKLMESMNLYETLLKGLNEGSTELGVTELSHVPTSIRLDTIKELWETKYKNLFQAIIDNNDPNALAIINRDIVSYVDRIHEMVNNYSEFSLSKVKNAILINGLLGLAASAIAYFSFHYIDRGIRRPISSLTKNLKELFPNDNRLTQKLKFTKKDEITEMAEYFDELIYDVLTKALNRKAGLSKLNQRLSRADRKKPLSLCFIDINGLKQVNDELGHIHGDELIISVTHTIRSTIREKDFIVRMGGDEFLIVFDDTTGDVAESIWERIVQVFEKINVEENRPYLISVSHGIQQCYPDENIDMNLLIQEVDDIMYKEKRKIKEQIRTVLR